MLGNNGESAKIGHFANYGKITSGIVIENGSIDTIANYDTMGGLYSKTSGFSVVMENYGTINIYDYNDKKAHFAGSSAGYMTLIIKKYAMKIDEGANTFNAFSGEAKDNSHIVLKDATATFADGGKLILDFGENFELGSAYSLDKLVVNSDGKNALPVDISRLISKNDIFEISQSGNKFFVSPKPQNSAVARLYSANIRTMNNFSMMTNAIIFPRKSVESTNNSPSLRDSANSPSLRDSANLDSAFVILSEVKNLADSAKNYHFIFTPFINHNSFAQAGNYALSGFNYGFITAFSARVAESHTLGAHFALTYGTLSDAKITDLQIKNLNLLGGLHYKIDLPFALFLKARGDFYYFSNDLKTQFLADIKPQNLGFGFSTSFGKTFDFRAGGALSIEAGFDYKALKSKEIKADSAIYQNALFNLI
ncbi:hypothetical protein ACWIUD_11805, partial [Helicobacter sp. 23-1044]